MEAEVQLNFIVRFKASRKGLMQRLEEIRGILERSLVIAPEYKEFYSVIAVQLRLLLCDNANSFLYKITDSPTLPPLRERYIETTSSVIQFNEDMFDYEATSIPLEEWLKQDLMFFKRTANDIPKTIENSQFEQIKSNIKPHLKRVEFASFYITRRITYEGQEMEFQVLKEHLSDEEKNELYLILKESGYNNLNLFHLIKLVADKLGAHADEELPIGLILIRSSEKDYRGYLDEIGRMMLNWIDEFIEKTKIE